MLDPLMCHSTQHIQLTHIATHTAMTGPISTLTNNNKSSCPNTELQTIINKHTALIIYECERIMYLI